MRPNVKFKEPISNTLRSAAISREIEDYFVPNKIDINKMLITH